MKELIEEAWRLGADGDKIQAFSSREDWDGLRSVIAERKAAIRIEQKAASVEAVADLPPVEAVASLVKSLRESNTRLRKTIESPNA